MAGGIHKLKSRTIETVKKQGLYNDGGGLYLAVSKTGNKTWTYIWSERGKRRQMGLGGLTSVSVSRARDKAQLARENIADGKNPIKERDRNTDRTFGACADKLIKDNEKSWKHEKHRAQWLRTVNHYCADLRDKQVADIDTQDVLGAIKPIWTDKPETARRLRARIERILDFAGSHGWRTGDNPARWKGHLKNIMPLQAKGGNYAALPYVDVPSFMKDLRDKDTMSARALELYQQSPRGRVMSGARSTFKVIAYREDSKPQTFTGRQAWTLQQLVTAGEKGCTPLLNPAPRWSDYVLHLRAAGLSIETIREEHFGQFAGHHGRYVLRTPLRLEVISPNKTKPVTTTIALASNSISHSLNTEVLNG